MRSHPRMLLHLAGYAVFLTAGSITAQAAESPTLPQDSGLDAHGSRPGWARHETGGWRLPGGASIRVLNEPKDSPILTRDQARPVRPAEHHKKLDAAELQTQTAISGTAPTGEVLAYVIHSPPINGFIPWITVLATDKSKSSDYWDVDPSFTIQGPFLVPDPQTAYGVGLLDTGASFSIMSNATAEQLGLFTGGLNTGGTVPITGVTGTIDAWVSQPLGLWITGLDHVNSDLTLNTAGMLGEWNVSIAMGPDPEPGMPDFMTAIGTPMSVYFATWIRNDTWRSVQRNGVLYEGPDISFHAVASTALPSYPNHVPLQLRPVGASDVWFWPCFAALEYCPGGDGSPKIPTTIIGNSMQSLFFASSVNLADNGHSAPNKTNFMLDTGAQVTVIASIIAAQLGLDLTKPDFTVEIQGVDGQVQYKPGFLVDSLEIPATGQWLIFNQVPVVVLDMASPEGGTLDGILGMNLFTRYNLVLRGGGLPGLPTNPVLDFMALPSINADYSGDGDIDVEDFAYLQTCISGRDVPQTNLYCEGAFLDGDSDIDEHDIQLFIDCASGPGVPPAPECIGR